MSKRRRDQGDTPPPKKPSDTRANQQIKRREQRALRRKNLDPNAAETTKIAGKRRRDPKETPPSDQGNAQKTSDTSANRRDHRASAAELRAKKAERRREEAQRRREEEAQRRREEALAAIMNRLDINKNYTVYYLRF